MKKKKLTFDFLFYYFVVISFLLPKGYAEYSSTYHTITNLMTWGATFAIWLYYFISVSKKSKLIANNLSIFLYFIYIFIITIVLRGFSINGFQKLICYPSIFLFIIYTMDDNPRLLLNTFCNVLLVDFTLNLFFKRSFFATQYHMTFLGHVQLISQLGLIAIFCSVLYFMYYRKSKLRTIAIIFLCVYTMFSTDASTALIAIVILLFMYFCYRVRMYHFLKVDTKYYILFGLLISSLILFLSVRNNIVYNNVNRIFDFNGRSFVWVAALESIRLQPIFGYGIEGILLKVFWNNWVNQNGFNYAHNQIMQNMLDGGVVGLFLFWKMVNNCVKNINKIKEKKYKLLFNSVLIVFLIIMLVESVSLYCYFYMFLAFSFSFYKIENEKNQEV